MRCKVFSTLIFVYLGLSGWVSGQISEKAIPFSAVENLPAITFFEEMPAIDTLCFNSGSAPSENRTKHLQFACPLYTQLNPDNSGEWIETPGGNVWRLGIRSAYAHSLYISMDFKLDPGTKLFIYGEGYKDLRGAFTSQNNNPVNILTIAPLAGESLVIELNLPRHKSSFGKLQINKVYHDFLNIFKDGAPKTLKSARIGGCDEDINCKNGRYWQTEKRAVCKIISSGGMGTGVLIGNTSGSGTPYLITANHIISSAEIAAEAVFLFNYETSGCQEDQVLDGGSISGATLLSTTDRLLDFTLLELHEKPPLSFKPFYAGWDARNLISRKGVSIHHPFGESKQIAIEYHSLVNEDIGRGFDPESTWKVSHWEVGTTEQGSSGAPLFDGEHRVIGTLTGGRSTCGYSKDDYFTKFGVSWNAYPDSANQLEYWLDPAQTGQLFISGYDPYGFNEQYCDTAWNYTEREQLELSNRGLDWGWVSGHNSAGFSQFAERFESESAIKISGAYLNVAKAYSSNPLANIELKVWEGVEFPESEIYSKLIFIKDLLPGKVNYIAFDSVFQKSSPLFVGYKINYSAVSDTFAVYHARHREKSGLSSMYSYNDKWYRASDSHAFGLLTSLGIGISECYGRSFSLAADFVKVYPNPCKRFVSLELPRRIPIQEVKCFDTSGRPMQVSLEQTEEGNKLHFDLKAGIYFLRIRTQESSYQARFLVAED